MKLKRRETCLYCGEPAQKELEECREKLAVATEALEFYGRGKHIEDLKLDLEVPSGEPENWECDSDDKFNLENGGIARHALSKIEIKEGEKK